MNRLLARLAAGLALSLAFTFASAAEPAKGKSPGDVAAEAFFKLHGDKEAPLNAARIQQLQAAGFGFLTSYPTHSRAGSVINALVTFGSTIRDKKLAPLRDYWGSQLNYEIVNRRTKSDVTADVGLVLASLDAACVGSVVKTAGSREKLDNYRAKIDQLAELEGSMRFRPAHERDYIQVVYTLNAKAGEAQARKLAGHPDKKLAAVGQEELNLIELAKGPLELKADTLDGRGFDAAQLRGKVLYFIFWSTTDEASQKDLTPLKDYYKPYQKLGVEIITVSHDTDRAAAEKFMKDKGYVWPVLFDGRGTKGEFSMKLNIAKLPGSALFNQQGLFVSNTVRTSKLEPEVMKLGIKRK
ncbi:MAG: TlpA disulfide reductase family protein [Lacunisphaera sp.]|nr:TlpA disulfide reductase family protein [Lacunisphaera sp.]